MVFFLNIYFFFYFRKGEQGALIEKKLTLLRQLACPRDVTRRSVKGVGASAWSRPPRPSVDAAAPTKTKNE